MYTQDSQTMGPRPCRTVTTIPYGHCIDCFSLIEFLSNLWSYGISIIEKISNEKKNILIKIKIQKYCQLLRLTGSVGRTKN